MSGMREAQEIFLRLERSEPEAARRVLGEIKAWFESHPEHPQAEGLWLSARAVGATP